MGIACRFGFEVERRPVAATVWLMVVCRRPSSPMQRRKRAEIRVHELRELSPLLDHRDDLVVGADRAQHLAVGRVAGLSLASRRELELLEEDPPELLRRAEHELLAREVVRAGLELLDSVVQPSRDLAHPVRVDADSRVLHRAEHDGQRELDLPVEALGAALGDLRGERLGESAGRLRMPDESRGLLLGRRIRLELDPVLRHEVVERVLGPPGVDQVRGDHRVVGDGRTEPQRLRVVDDDREVRSL